MQKQQKPIKRDQTLTGISEVLSSDFILSVWSLILSYRIYEYLSRFIMSDTLPSI